MRRFWLYAWLYFSLEPAPYRPHVGRVRTCGDQARSWRPQIVAVSPESLDPLAGIALAGVAGGVRVMIILRWLTAVLNADRSNLRGGSFNGFVPRLATQEQLVGNRGGSREAAHVNRRAGEATAPIEPQAISGVTHEDVTLGGPYSAGLLRDLTHCTVPPNTHGLSTGCRSLQ
jgi:hypothetical protein